MAGWNPSNNSGQKTNKRVINGSLTPVLHLGESSRWAVLLETDNDIFTTLFHLSFNSCISLVLHRLCKLYDP